jgi:hypothetical protein
MMAAHQTTGLHSLSVYHGGIFVGDNGIDLIHSLRSVDTAHDMICPKEGWLPVPWVKR